MVGFTTAVVVEHNGLTVIYYFMFTHAPTYAHTHKHMNTHTHKYTRNNTYLPKYTDI